MFAVTIRERIAPGKVLHTDAVFLTPEELREEHARALHEERVRRERSERQSATWTAYHERRKEGAA